MQLSDIKKDISIIGFLPEEAVTVISVTPFGSDACEVLYRRRTGEIGNQMVYLSELPNLKIIDQSGKFDFSCDPKTFKIVSEAERIQLAYLFDPYIAVHTSAIEPLPHQITAVYEKMLPKHPLRFVLADDPGAGKTIMAGLLIKELMIRGDVKRCLIVSPGNITEQWQDELYSKFNIHFEILTNDMLESAASGNAFDEHDLLIARLDKLSRNEDVQSKIHASEWDLIIVDEAHKMAASVMGNNVTYTKRYKLGLLLSQRTRHFLLMTATPHNGKEADFQQFMSLIDADRFQCHSNAIKTDATYDDVMRRLVKEELLKFDGRPLFPERFAQTVSYDLSEPEKELYEDVTSYVRDQFNRAEKLKNDKKTAVGFALTLLQRRLASSPEAIYQSLKHRKERLTKKLEDIKQNGLPQKEVLYQVDFDDIDDELTEEEMEDFGNDVLDATTAAETIQEMEAEIAILDDLESKADTIRKSNHDCKWEQLSRLIQSPEFKDQYGNRQKLIIFTEHKDTLRYLAEKVRNLLGRSEAVITIHGGMLRAERKLAESQFKQEKSVSILIATDAAGEGINLQRAHLMINYDIPWNPNRIEQRFGRIHRIGQTEICHLWNMVASDTREGQVFERLFTKLEQERTALGGKVFDVLGKLTFDNKPLRDILIEAIRFGNEPEHKNYIHTVVDNALDVKHLEDLIDSHALTNEILDVKAVNRIREDMERMNARRLQPYYIQDFFESAFSLAGGSYYKRETGRFEVTRVPQCIQLALNSTKWGTKVLRRYERITFVKEGISVDGKPEADLICPGHPLLDSLISWVESKYGSDFYNGTVLIDPQNHTDKPSLLCCLDTAIRDGMQDGNHNRVIARQMSFVEIQEDGSSRPAGFAPYLDYGAAPDGNKGKIQAIIKSQCWVSGDIEKMAVTHAVKDIIPEMLNETRTIRIKTIDKIQHEVEARLSAEINYWDGKTAIYNEKIKKGDNSQATKNNRDQAIHKAELLDGRRSQRIHELYLERQIVSMTPILKSIALVIPSALIDSTDALYGKDRKAIEMAGMNAVMDIERTLGFTPRDVSALNLGYDIESTIPESMRSDCMLRCIEVKGRSADHCDSVTLSRNEINTGLNIPSQFILALVTVDGDKTETTYCMNSFTQKLDPSANSITYDVKKLIENSIVIYDERKR